MTRFLAVTVCLVFRLAIGSAEDHPPAPRALLQVPLGLDAYMPIPEDNPLTPEKIALGKRLFSDAILSRDRSISCATCHDPRHAFTDDKPVAVGMAGAKGTRRVPALINRGYGSAFFWDGRVSTLEEQVLKPIQAPNEMDMTLSEAAARLGLPPDEISRALASYVRTILSGDSPVDRYLNSDSHALPDEARRGLNIFRGKANCIACHVGPNFTDEHFHNTGVAWRGGKLRDPGRSAVTGKEADRGAFKVPTLREVARTAPYMHDGSMATLEEVVEFYNRGGNPNPYLDPEIHPLHLTPGEKRALIAFLKSLTGPHLIIDEPAPRRSRLVKSFRFSVLVLQPLLLYLARLGVQYRDLLRARKTAPARDMGQSWCAFVSQFSSLKF